MLLNDRKTLLYFVTRTGMYIFQQDYQNIVSFIHGFETGNGKNDFTEQMKTYIAKQFRIKAGATGWNGQIERLSEKLNYGWTITFKKISLEILIVDELGNLNEELGQILKTRIQSLIERIEKKGNPFFNNDWTEEWLSFCSLKSNWFRQMWTLDELEIIKALDIEVHADNIFIDKEDFLPTKKLIELQGQYQTLTKNNSRQHGFVASGG
jgi:hypothetical protein